MLCIACFEDGLKENVPWNCQKEKEVIWLWRLPSSNSNRRSSTEPATSPCGASDTKYIGNQQSPPQQKLNQWVVQKMKNALEEWHYWEDAYCLTYRFGCGHRRILLLLRLTVGLGFPPLWGSTLADDCCKQGSRPHASSSLNGISQHLPALACTALASERDTLSVSASDVVFVMTDPAPGQR